MATSASVNSSHRIGLSASPGPTLVLLLLLLCLSLQNGAVYEVVNDVSTDGQPSGQGARATHPAVQWPGGRFGLLQPKTGCPDSALFSNHSFFKINTQSRYGDHNRDHATSAFPPSTVSQETTGNFVTLNFCKRDAPSASGSWPRGTYCFNTMARTMECPDHFAWGRYGIATEEIDNHDEFTEDFVEMQYGRPAFSFCCRRDYSPSPPLEFPSSAPFMLYRMDGSCPRVKDMTFSEESVTITGDYATYRSNSLSVSGSLPDIDNWLDSLPTFHLCYYTPDRE